MDAPTATRRARSARRPRVLSRVPGRPTQKAAARLKQICLQAALASFLEHGFAGTTIDGVARLAKASRATVYRIFDNKEGLFRAVHQWVLARRQSDLRSQLAHNRPPEEMLAAVIDQIYADSIRPQDLALTRLFVAESHRFPGLADTLFEHALFEPLIAYLNALSLQGLADIDDPVEAAWDLAALAVGGLRLLLKDPIADPDLRRKRAARLARLVTRGWLRVKPASA